LNTFNPLENYFSVGGCIGDIFVRQIFSENSKIDWPLIFNPYVQPKYSKYISQSTYKILIRTAIYILSSSMWAFGIV
jgi:hypothetical protein